MTSHRQTNAISTCETDTRPINARLVVRIVSQLSERNPQWLDLGLAKRTIRPGPRIQGVNDADKVATQRRRSTVIHRACPEAASTRHTSPRSPTRRTRGRAPTRPARRGEGSAPRYQQLPPRRPRKHPTPPGTRGLSRQHACTPGGRPRHHRHRCRRRSAAVTVPLATPTDGYAVSDLDAESWPTQQSPLLVLLEIGSDVCTSLTTACPPSWAKMPLPHLDPLMLPLSTSPGCPGRQRRPRPAGFPPPARPAPPRARLHWP